MSAWYISEQSEWTLMLTRYRTGRVMHGIKGALGWRAVTVAVTVTVPLARHRYMYMYRIKHLRVLPEAVKAKIPDAILL